jgi:hypothetical protein
MPTTITRVGPTLRLGRTRPAGVRSSGSGILSRNRSLAGYTIDTRESEFSEGTTAPSYLIRDNDRAYGHVFTCRVKAMGIRDRPISPRSPWQNGIAERLIGTLRRECLDHVVVFGERHLRCVLLGYAAYYNQTRPHRPLRKDAPLRRTIQRIGGIAVMPILGGLHHQYVRI